jgi:hypothetical protein
MSVMRKSLLLLLATFALASCGGGGSGSHSIFTPPGTDTALSLVATTTTLPASPFTVGDEETSPFPGNFPGSPYISEVTVTWRHNNGDLVTGTSSVNVAASPVQTISFSFLNTGSTDNFHPLLGSGPIDVTAGTGTIFVHAGQTPGTGTLIVSAVDPVSNQNISSQLTFTVVGASSGVPASITISPASGVYVSNSGGPQSTVVSATVTDGSGALVTAPSGVSNVQFQIVGPAGTDATLVGVDGAGSSHSGTTVDVPSHNGIATVTFQSGSQQGAVQVQATADRGDNNVDNGISNPVSATTTVTVSDGKLFSITIDSPDTGAVTSTGVAANATEDPPGSGNYELTISAKGVDRLGNPVLPGTQIGFGDIDSPQVPNATTGPQGWFLISGSHGDPQEGGNIFTATDGKFTTAGGGAGPGDALLVIGKQTEGAPQGNDDLDSAVKITTVNSATTLTVATPFNLNDYTGVSVNNGPVLPYLIGRAESSSIVSPSYTDTGSSAQAGVAVTTLNYPASQIGKAVAVWAQGTGTDTNASPGRTDVVTDIATLVFPGVATGAFMSASPDPIQGNTVTTETVCYYDGNGRPIANYDISFAFDFGTGGVGSGTVDGTQGSGKLKNLTNSSGCVSAQLTTASIPPSESGAATVTFSAGPTNTGASDGGATTFVTVPIVISAAQIELNTACPSVPAGTTTPTTLPVSLTLLDANGNGISGQTINGECTVTSSGGTITTTNGTTGANGNTTVFITVTAPDTTTVVKGVCQYSSSSFPSLVASVAINGGGSCGGGFSPSP